MVTYGVTYDIDLEWLEDHFSEIEFDYENNHYMFDGNFYVNDNSVDEQDSDWVEVEDINLLSALEDCLFEQQEVVDKIISYVEERIGNISDKGDLKDYIEEI